MKKNLVLVSILAIGLTLSACYQNAHTTTQINTYSYQFDEPKDYCREHDIDSGFELYCPEGKIIIEFVPLINKNTTNDTLDQILSKIPETFNHSTTELHGKNSTITLVELSNGDLSLSNNTFPTYIAVFPFDADYIVVAKGFLYKTAFEEQFKPAFRVVVKTLEPF
jgi:hypothetical protein